MDADATLNSDVLTTDEAAAMVSEEPRPPAEEHDWPQENRVDLFDLADAAGKLVGDCDDRPAALGRFFAKLKNLEQAWYHAEMKYNALKSANERLTNQLVHFRAKCAIYQKKLRFIQDNQKNFAKLKEVYMTMKCEEGVKSFVDLKDRSSQTVPMTVTSNPLTSTGATIDGCLVPVKADSLVTIRKSEINEAQRNLQILREMISNREQSWVLGRQIEDGLRSEVRALQTQKSTLEEIVGIKDSEIRTLKSIQLEPCIKKELFDQLGVMIMKMDRRMKDLEKVGKIGRYIVMFSERERQLLQEILDNHLPKKQVVEMNAEMAKLETKLKETVRHKRRPNSSKSLTVSVVKKDQNKALINPSEQQQCLTVTPLPKRLLLSDISEIDALQKIKREIEEKQSALKEKVQQILENTPGHSK